MVEIWRGCRTLKPPTNIYHVPMLHPMMKRASHVPMLHFQLQHPMRYFFRAIGFVCSNGFGDSFQEIATQTKNVFVQLEKEKQIEKKIPWILSREKSKSQSKKFFGHEQKNSTKKISARGFIPPNFEIEVGTTYPNGNECFRPIGKFYVINKIKQTINRQVRHNGQKTFRRS